MDDIVSQIIGELKETGVVGARKVARKSWRRKMREKVWLEGKRNAMKNFSDGVRCKQISRYSL